MNPSRLVSLLVPLLAASPAWAHPGHGRPDLVSSWLHYVLEPEHFGVLLVFGLGLAAVLRLAPRRPAD